MQRFCVGLLTPPYFKSITATALFVKFLQSSPQARRFPKCNVSVKAAGKSLMLSPDIKALWLAAHMQLKVILMLKIYLARVISYMNEAQKQVEQSWREGKRASICDKGTSRSSAPDFFCVCVFVFLQDNINPAPSAERSFHPQAMPVYGIEIVGWAQRLSKRGRRQSGERCRASLMAESQ